MGNLHIISKNKQITDRCDRITYMYDMLSINYDFLIPETYIYILQEIFIINEDHANYHCGSDDIHCRKIGIVYYEEFQRILTFLTENI
jgi:hypothetical protein